MAKIRIDSYLYEAGYAESREKAKRLLMAGQVLINEQIIDKAGTKIDLSQKIQIRIKETEKYVSRGGYKLEQIISNNQININNLVCLDIGSSTGGFTDCLIQNGAKFVYALDVGTNQLHWKIRTNEQVKSLENTNYRYVNLDLFDQTIDLIVTDVSFISIITIIEKSIELFPNTNFIGLIKPQFEVGAQNLSKGIVKSEKIALQAVDKVIAYLKSKKSLIYAVEKSPIKGQKGNQEYLVFCKLGDNNE